MKTSASASTRIERSRILCSLVELKNSFEAQSAREAGLEGRGAMVEAMVVVDEDVVLGKPGLTAGGVT